MKKLGLVFAMLLCSMFLMTSNAMATLIPPDVEFDSGGIATYTASTGKFTISAVSMKVYFPGDATAYWIDHSATDTVDFWAEYESGGNSSPWYFKGDSGHTDPDIVVNGTLSSWPGGFIGTGVLYTGNIRTMKYDNNAPGFVTGLWDITGGDLAPYADSPLGEFLIALEFGVHPTFGASTNPTGSGNNFVSYGAKGDISTTPEPASVALLGLGLLGMAGRVIKRRFTA